MRKKSCLYCWLLLFVAFLIQFSGCTQYSGSAVSEPAENVLKVGVSTNAPPLIYKKKGEIQGLEADFALQLGRFLGKRIKFVELNWQEQIPSLEKGRIDIIMSGMTITAKRSYRVAFAKPYLRSGQILLVRSDQGRKYSSGIYSLMGNNVAIGVVENTTGDFFITKTINRPDLTKYKTSGSAVKALVAGKIDAVVHDAPILCYYAAMNEGETTPILQMATEEHLAWAVNKVDTELLFEVNRFIEIESQNTGLKTTIQRWIPYMK